MQIPKDTKESGSVFADDCVSWAFGYNAQQAAESVQFFLNGFEGWCKAWRTIPEPSKSNAIIFSRNPNIRKQKFTLTLLGENIPQVKKVTFLGVDLEETITWKANTDKMIGKAASTINSIKKLVPIFGKSCPDIVHEAFDALFISIFAYSCPVYTDMAECQWKKIETLQNKALRQLYYLPPKISTNLLFKTTGETPIRKTLETQASRRVHKILNNTAHITDYLWDFKDLFHINKYQSLLQYYMNNPRTQFPNQFKCPNCCFVIDHDCLHPL